MSKSFFAYNPYKLLSVFSTSLLQLRLHTRRLAIRFVFLRPPAVRPTVLGFPPQNNDFICVSPLLMDAHGVSPITFNSFGILLLEPLFDILLTQNISNHWPPPESRRHLRLGVLPPFSMFTLTASYLNFSRYI